MYRISWWASVSSLTWSKVRVACSLGSWQKHVYTCLENVKLVPLTSEIRQALVGVGEYIGPACHDPYLNPDKERNKDERRRNGKSRGVS